MNRDNSGDLFKSLQLFSRRPRRGENEDFSGRRPGNDPAAGSSRVKRSLFGRGNHEENIRFAQNELKRSLSESTKRWNFDFEAGRPLDGRFVWETSPGPRILSKKPYSRENSENHHPSSLHLHTSSSSPCSLEALASTSSSSSSSCDKNGTNNAAESSPTASKNTLATAEVMSANAGAPSSCQRTPQQQSSIIEHFRQRKRSKSKVKMQERRHESPDETPPPLAVSLPAAESD